MLFTAQTEVKSQNRKPRIIVTSDSDMGDECSMVCFFYIQHAKGGPFLWIADSEWVWSGN